MPKIANVTNTPVSSSVPSLTLGNANNFLGANSLDCKGSGAFGTFAGMAAPINGLVGSGFLGVRTATQFLSGSTAEFFMPTTSSECNIVQTTYAGSGSANGSNLIHFTARGTALAPTANQMGDALGIWGIRGYNGTDFVTTSKASITMLANETWTTNANGTAISFQITPPNSTTPSEIVRALSTSASISGLAITRAGSGFMIKEGANARMGIARLVPLFLAPSSVTVANNTVTLNTRIFLTNNNPSGLALGEVFVALVIPGVSFTIASIAMGDTSSIAWLLVEPAP
ncbi:hypothetical protein RHABOEDO_001899 (plasmid) [Candidatus Rhabdochlamydia oedothoracis]|uniref:K1 capsule-specific polysaccharide lyase C-terminal domain-containing protein n=1 Tax=Candidatus Rhabdochlamydia oedothoracis TaxID=2720720 RepID=A0ABX8V2N1_9BACT|nr:MULTISPECIES: hypothetical protein [Rhabdochlamydia]KAG6559273.1 hypothetical protein RHOW815_000732 [Candidatus Rhabdochlamydia sp. W815]QYF49500.1 hypothetical protein RHABOEDO_001899 [Candidatus Rhabdochlamydia oedothoracis]